MKLLILEYGPGIKVCIDRAAAISIQKHSERLKSKLGLNRQPLTVVRCEEGYEISARDFAGFTSVGGIQIEVVPKFLALDSRKDGWRDAFFAILTRLGYVPSDLSTGYGDGAGSIPDIAAEIITTSLEKSERLGDPRQYRDCREPLSAVRGRIDIPKYWQRVVDPSRIPCRYQDFTEDIAPNRLLKWALKELLPEVGSAPLALRMAYQIERLVAVADTEPPYPEYQLRLPPQFSHCGLGVETAKLLADNKLSNLEGSSLNAGVEMIWPTARIFEDFTFRIFEVAAESLGGNVKKIALPLGEASKEGRAHGDESFATTPDLLINLPSGPILLDAKYKNIGASPKNSDVYQVITGAKLVGARRCGLVYPGTFQSRRRRKWKLAVPGQPSVIEAFTYDMTAMENRGGFEALVQLAKSWLGNAPKLPTVDNI